MTPTAGHTIRVSAQATARALRRAPERLLHPWRRRRAELLVARAAGPVLVLCHGNICRSPYAEAVLRRLLEAKGVVVESAGFIGPGRPSPAAAQRAARQRGHDLSGHRSRLLTPEAARAARLVIVMNQAQRTAFRARSGSSDPVVILGDLDPAPIQTREVLDPVDREALYFMAVYDRIDRCCARLAELLGTARPAEDHAA